MDEENKKATKTIECSSVPANAISSEVIESRKYRDDASRFNITCKKLMSPVEDVSNELNTINSYEEIHSNRDVFVETISDSVMKIEDYNSSIEESLANLPEVIMKKAEELDEENTKYKCVVPID